jgi:hypothetical protein
MTGDFGSSSSPVIGSPPQLLPIFPAWEPKHDLLWGQQPIWMWLSLLRVNEVDSRYGELLDSIFDEIQGHIPGYHTFRRINGILISSPTAQVYYHFDTSRQSLWQISGHKRVYVYPPPSPFLSRQELEEVCLYHNETSIRYEPWYYDYATVFEIGPGQMLTWPLNAPHRVENLGFSVSMTVEYGTSSAGSSSTAPTACCGKSLASCRPTALRDPATGRRRRSTGQPR